MTCPMLRGPRSLSIVLVLGLWACRSEPPTAASRPADKPQGGPVAVDDPTTCAPCHTKVFQEWNQSMHAHAHSSKDPIYKAMLAAHIKNKGPDVAKACANCHGPRAADKPQGAIAQHGVSCASCHAVSKVKNEGRGAMALQWTANDELLGPHDGTSTGSPAHGTGPAPAHMKDGTTLCLACHGAMKNALGAAVCTTGPEWTEGGKDKSCVSCHMPLVETTSGSVSTRKTHRSHRFIGPRGTWGTPDFEFVSTAIDVSGELKGDRLQVTLTNKALHAVPTGFPGRVIALIAKGFDAEGKPVWTGRPTLLNKVYLNAAGKPTMPAFAKSLGKDNRLKPNEVRKLDFKVPAKVSDVKVRLVYRLLPPPAAKALGLTKSPLGGMKLIKQMEIARTR